MKENHRPSEQRNSFLRVLPSWLCILVVALALPLASRAQDTGYISGTVVDKSGAAVVGAEVVLTNAGGSLTRNTASNTDGAYVISGLPGDTYTITVTAKGFQKYQAKGVKLDVAQKTRIDIQMTVGAITETVEVTGEAVAQVETTSSDLTSTITGTQINNLVLNGRNFTQLVNLAPGVVSQTNQDDAKVGVYGNVAYSMNGGRTEYNNWELDGGDNMDNGSNSTLNVYPNPEAIAEFKVLTSNYGAQYGRNGSGTVEVETKSGGSTFHGSAFEYLRNEFFNAKSWEEGADPTAKKAPYKKHDFGYTIGGPVYIPGHYNTDKKKTFFFFSEEWRREKNPHTTGLVNVPSDTERTGNFGDLCPASGDFFRTNPNDKSGNPVLPPNTPLFADCPATGKGPVVTAADGTQAQSYVPFAGNQVTIDPVGQALLALVPKASPGLTNNGFPAVLQTVSLPETWREELIRVDHNITDNYRLTFRYIHDSWQTQTENALWGNGTSFEDINTEFVGPGTSFVARLNANISPTLLNEFVASYTADHIFLTALHNPPLPSGLPMGLLFQNGQGGKLPSISLGNNLSYGGGFSADTGYFPWNNANPVYTYRDNLTKIVGTHTMSIGVYTAFAQKNEQNSPYVQGILTFDSSNTAIPSSGNAFADLLTGKVAQFSQVNLQAKYYNRYRIVEPYFQDDWRVTKRFTLNLGLRLSLYGTYRERYRHAFNFEPAAFTNNGSPQIDDGTGPTGQEGAFIPGPGNPFNGVVQCGGAGGSSLIPSLVTNSFPGATIGSSSNAGCLNGHLFNPAPRIGFAWDPKGDGKMAVRGGYGVFFEHTNGNEGNTESLEGSPPYSLNASQFNVNGYSNIGGGLLFPLGVNSIPSKAIWPYVQQFHLDVQKELPSHFVATVSYVGSKGTHLTQQRNLNQLLPVTSGNPFAAGQPITSADCDSIANNNPPTLANGTPVAGAALTNLGIACGNDPNTSRPLFGFGDITRLEDQANSIYHAMQTTVRRTVGDLTMSLAYTYSHSIDNSSDRYDGAFVNSYNLAANRGNSGFDVRHNLAISYVYGLPFFKGSGLAHNVLGGWQVSGITIAQTGTPFSVTNGTDFGDAAGVANGVGTGSRPDQVGSPHASSTDIPGVRGPLLFNPGAYTTPTGLTFGNVGRNTLYGPGRINFDFGLFKRFSFTETRALDFRWENFNLFNHTQYNGVNGGMDCVGASGTAGDPICINGDPANNVAASSFLHASGAHLARRMQFGLRFQF
ncbi:MAG TPA: carboxypeptidase regulatory-like domain-containing protein [Candidatus Acidoferrum sp.]|nr:carboxypeptidase regulatory-like domain-containing protein [Candidatus Acidoferrum sp.]